MATLYFNGAVDGDWNELGNWWQDSAGTVAATAIPGVADTAYVIGASTVSTNSGDPASVANIFIIESSSFEISATVSGLATVGASPEGIAYLYPNSTGVSIDGNAAFYGASQLGYGSVTGTAEFYDFSTCYDPGENGHVIFYDYSRAYYTKVAFEGTITFNDFSVLWGGIYQPVSCTITFNDDSAWEIDTDSFVDNSNITFNDRSACGNSSYPRDEAGQGGQSWSSCVIVFNDDSLYWVGGSGYESSWNFRGRSKNYSGTMVYAKPVFENDTGINGSSILGVV